MERLIEKIPIVGPFILRTHARLFRVNSARYWEHRYAQGGNSGDGSYGAEAEYKAHFLNHFVADNHVRSVIEFGCGDGNQLSLANYETYTGVDISETALKICRQKFPEYHFVNTDSWRSQSSRMAELSLSLDVVYHCVEDSVFEDHMRCVFSAASKFVVIYSTNHYQPNSAPHVRHRVVTDWIAKSLGDWKLVQEHCPNASLPFAWKRCHFLVYSRATF